MLDAGVKVTRKTLLPTPLAIVVAVAEVVVAIGAVAKLMADEKKEKDG